TAGLGLGIISFASVAEAGVMLGNGSSLTGQTSEKQPQQQLKGMSDQGSSLTGQKTEKQPQQQLKGSHDQGSSLSGQKTEKQPAQ
ncbi:MAG: hypothetical protein QNJ72_17760, partial [Pleurocapsa sp. MO_226.B13]|nr:hypothetical protein [Pleurocapsa sp. MO_226.B13]